MGLHLVLEVIGGPMDGFRRPLIGKEITIGRKIGQDIALDRDRKISNRHAFIRLEGHDWCLGEDKIRPSKNGTSIDGKWIQPGEKYPLRPNQVIVLGSTTMEVCIDSPHENAHPTFNHEDGNPREVYQMDPDLDIFWERMESENREKGFVDSRSLFRSIAEKEREPNGALFECVVNSVSADCWIALGKWILDKRLDPLYSIEKGDVVYPPRIWKILDIASSGNSKSITFDDILQAILDEGRSIPARYMAQDAHFIRSMNLRVPAKEIPTPLGSITDASFSRSMSRPETIAPSKETNATDSSFISTNRSNDEEIEFWRNQAGDFETMILAYIQDALLPPGVNIPFFLPGYNKRLEALLKTSDNERVAEYLDTLRENLFHVMQAYKESAEKVEIEIISRMREAIRSAENQVNGPRGLWPIGKGRGDGKLIEAIESDLKKIERAKLGERIPHQSIRSLFENGGRS